MSVEFETDDRPDPPDPSPSGGRRPRRYTIALLAACALAAIAWVATRPSPGAPRASVHTTAKPAPKSSVATSPTAAVSPDCRAVPDCSVSDALMPSVVTLVRQHLPTATDLAVSTVRARIPETLNDGLVARTLSLRVGPATVLVRVQRGGPATQALTPDPPGVGSLLVHAVNGGYVVRLQYLAPETVPPQLDRLRALIADPRLVVL